jgi:hypothetical protein
MWWDKQNSVLFAFLGTGSLAALASSHTVLLETPSWRKGVKAALTWLLLTRSPRPPGGVERVDASFQIFVVSMTEVTTGDLLGKGGRSRQDAVEQIKNVGNGTHALQNETTQIGIRSVFIWAAVCVSDTDRLCGLCHSRSVSKLLNGAAICVFPCHTSYFTVE